LLKDLHEENREKIKARVDALARERRQNAPVPKL
jgi:hypothetical protein